MAEISFDLAELFEKAFGYKTNAFNPEFPPAAGFPAPLRNEQGGHGSPYYAKDAAGREYYMPVTLIYSDKNQNEDPGDTGGQLKKWELPFPVVSISTRKTIIETSLTERRGTVKELINTEDYEITIKGLIINDANEFPERAVNILRTVYEQNATLSIQCPLTDVFLLRPDRKGSDHVVIKQLKFPAVTGIKNVRPYELILISDEPFNLIDIS